MSSVFVTALHVKDMPAASGTGGGDSGQRGDVPGEHDFDGIYDDEESGLPLDGFFADEEDEDCKRVSLSDEQKMICTPLVRGYALKEKMWLNFFVNAVQEIGFSTRAFDSLVLPSNHKELILGFTDTQQSYRSQFDDVIEGKGRGIILLLCGPPGVGKTLTAESVAEEMKVPLYMMSAGDLGLDPRHVESKLQGILEMCTRWNAILLLDEADVFLEQRSLHELERNKLVSIFLRVLEYYEGIMFLTTNRFVTHLLPSLHPNHQLTQPAESRHSIPRSRVASTSAWSTQNSIPSLARPSGRTSSRSTTSRKPHPASDLLKPSCLPRKQHYLFRPRTRRQRRKRKPRSCTNTARSRTSSPRRS